MESQCVFCETETEFLNCVYSNLKLQAAESNRLMVIIEWRHKPVGQGREVVKGNLWKPLGF